MSSTSTRWTWTSWSSTWRDSTLERSGPGSYSLLWIRRDVPHPGHSPLPVSDYRHLPRVATSDLMRRCRHDEYWASCQFRSCDVDHLSHEAAVRRSHHDTSFSLLAYSCRLALIFRRGVWPLGDPNERLRDHTAVRAADHGLFTNERTALPSRPRRRRLVDANEKRVLV